VRLLPIALVATSLAGCGILQALDGGSGAGSSSPAAAGTGGGSAQGIDCGTDPDTSATLCLGNTACPGLTIDTVVYPGCGFRVNGAAVDIECSCSGWLCPLGATSCAVAKQKLAEENYGAVCGQLGGGACIQGVPTPRSTSSSSGGSCDPTCRSECAGEPTCLQLCGC
jgi:hypothetical protein